MKTSYILWMLLITAAIAGCSKQEALSQNENSAAKFIHAENRV